jgi:predicted RNase H-like HicB family nuclease
VPRTAGEEPQLKQTAQPTAIIEREGSAYIALCPELDNAGPGDTLEEARRTLAAALKLFFAVAGPGAVERRLAAHRREGD